LNSQSILHRPDVFNAMTAKNRAGLITKLQTSLKKHYKPAPAAPGRPLMEHVLYAALLEDAPVDLADEGFAKCEQEFFDWNEVRVTSVTELAEVLSHFPSPSSTALRLKRCLQSVFESFYSFEIEHLKKENLGKAVAKFESMVGVSPFVLSYLIQHGLGGHAIPVNSSGMWIMFKTGIINEVEARTGKVPGLERAIPKSKAIEFSSMLHQAAVTLAADATSHQVWEIIWSVNKDAEMSAQQSESKRRSVKRAIASVESVAKPDSKPSGKSKSAATKAAGPAAEAIGKSAKPSSAKSTAKSKTTSETAKPADEAAKSVKTQSVADSGESTSKSKPKSKPAATEKSKSPAATVDSSKKPVEPKKPVKPKKGLNPDDPVAKSSASGKTIPLAKPGRLANPNAKPTPTTGSKSAKGGAASKESDKDSPPDPAVKPAKKPAAGKVPVGPEAATNAGELATGPAKDSTKKADAKKPKETTPAAEAGNQKLTKQKPR
jgi:hypothetical protein